MIGAAPRPAPDRARPPSQCKSRSPFLGRADPMNGRLTKEDYHAWHILVDRIGVGGAFLSGIALPNNREGAPPNRSLVEGPAYWAMNYGSSGARCSTPNDTGAASRTNRRTAVDRASASSSAAFLSE